MQVKALEMGVAKPREGSWAKQQGLVGGTDLVLLTPSKPEY